ncbi:MAG: hypothetical protein IH790_09505 [Acidobacteria bacterium]|nr:hypothetical protein [Acidobacteriota bacterium]
MFESEDKPRSPHFWRIIVISVVLFVATTGLLVFLLQQGVREEVPLTGILHAGDPDYDWYGKYMDLESPKVQMSKSLSGNRLVIFSAIIENNGERTVDVVEVELSFFNYDKLISSVIRTPRRPGPYTPPIQTFEKRVFTVYVAEIPPNWLAQTAEIAIHVLRFLAKP